MKPGTFILNGVHSDELNTLISTRPTIETPPRRIELKEIPGVNGAIPFDEGSYGNTSMQIEMFYKVMDEEDLPAQRSEVASHFLFTRYVDFIPYFDPDKVYRVINTDYPKFDGNSTYRNFDTFDLTFSVKPFKFFVGNPTFEVASGSASTIVNQTKYTAEPLITITGSGDCTLTINGVNYVVMNIVDEVILDSEIEHCYKIVNGLVVNENSKMYSVDFPELVPGGNTIAWTGAGVTKVSIGPRWRTLV